MMIRVVASRMQTMKQGRCALSTQAESALLKFKDAMQEYRLQHYRQETHNRFKREIVKAAKGSDDKIALESMSRVLNNIGADHKISTNELEVLFHEIGESGAIPADRFISLI